MAKPDLKSLFSFLEPGEQEPKAKIPYRAPAEMPEYEISKGLKPGEVQEVKPTEKSKTPNVDTTALVKKIGSKPKVIEEKHDIKGAINIPFGPEPTTPPPAPPVAEEPLPFEGMGQEGVPSEPPPSIEELVKKQTEGLGHVEGKQVRNAVIMKDQQDTTGREFASDSTVWDEIWPALVPVALNALIGNGTYEETFAIASDTLDKIQKEKKEWFKLQGKGRASKAAGVDRMALEQLQQQGRERLQSMRGEQGQKLAGAKAIYGEHLAGTKGDIAEKNIYTKGGLTTLENLGKDRRRLEETILKQEETTGRKGMDFVTVEHPVTKQHTSISRKELLAIPFDQRPRVVESSRGSQRLITEKDILNGKRVTNYLDPVTSKVVRTTEGWHGDTVGIPTKGGGEVTQKQYNSLVKPTVTLYEKDMQDETKIKRAMVSNYAKFVDSNNTATLGALVNTIRMMGEKGTLTDADYERYSSEVSIIDGLIAGLGKEFSGKVPPELRGRAVELAEMMIKDTDRNAENIRKQYVKQIQAKSQGLDVDPSEWDRHLADYRSKDDFLEEMKAIRRQKAKAGEYGGEVQKRQKKADKEQIRKSIVEKVRGNK